MPYFRKSGSIGLESTASNLDGSFHDSIPIKRMGNGGVIQTQHIDDLMPLSKNIPFKELYDLNLNAEELYFINENKDTWEDIVKSTPRQTFLYQLDFNLTTADTPYSIPLLFRGKKHLRISSLSTVAINLKNHPIVFGILKIYNKLCEHEYNKLLALSENYGKAFEGMLKRGPAGYKLFYVEKPSWMYYQYLRSGYVRRGFPNPFAQIKKINCDSKLTFLGKTLYMGGHPLFIKKLKKAKEILINMGVYDRLCQDFKNRGYGHLGTFCPRVQANASGVLSNHALGIAIDLDASHNPFITRSIGKAMDSVLKSISNIPGRFSEKMSQQEQKPTVGEMAKQLVKMEKLFIDFMKINLDSGLNQIKKAKKDLKNAKKIAKKEYKKTLKSLKDLEKKLSKCDIERNDFNSEAPLVHRMIVAEEYQLLRLKKKMEEKVTLSRNAQIIEDYLETYRGRGAWQRRNTAVTLTRSYIKNGIISIPSIVFSVLAEVGIESGITWRSKDTMHFEIPISKFKKNHTE